LADLQRTVYPHSGHRLAEGRAHDRVSSPAKDRVYVTVCIVNSASGGVGDTAEISSRTTNPMVKLFCGQFLSAGINEGMLLPWMNVLVTDTLNKLPVRHFIVRLYMQFAKC